jgi:predicted RNA methylase
MRRVKLEQLNIASLSRANAQPYAATKSRSFKKLIKSLHLPLDSVFVDFGSGKGRTLLLASRYKFKRIVGVEFSPELCVLARANIAKYAASTREDLDINIIEGDAAEYHFQGDENVLFFFNPFDASIMRRVLDNLIESLRVNPRKIWIIYNNPIHVGVIMQSQMFLQLCQFVYGSSHFIVFVSHQESAA